MIQFNKKFIEELKPLIPKKVMDLDIRFESEDDGRISDSIYGWIRFDGDRLDAIYLEMRALNFDPIAYGDKAVVIKFDIIDGGYKFNSIYKFPKTEIEHRFDGNVNFVAEYENYDKDLTEDFVDDYEFCAKVENGIKITSYIGNKAFSEGKEYPEFFDLLTTKGVIEGGDRNHEFNFFYKKGHKDVVYLILEPTLVEEDDGRVDGEIVGFVD